MLDRGDRDGQLAWLRSILHRRAMLLRIGRAIAELEAAWTGPVY
jgi:hypothetical protein